MALLRNLFFCLLISNWAIAQVSIPLQLYSEGRLQCAKVSPNGKQILTGSAGGWAILWDIETQSVLRRYLGHNGAVNAAAFSALGGEILTGSSDGTAKLWDTETGALIQTYYGHTDRVNSVQFSPEGSTFLTASWDRTAKLWNIKTGEILQTFDQHQDSIHCSAFSPTGDRIITGSWDNSAILWDVASGKVLYRLEGHQKVVVSADFSPDGKSVVTGSLDGTATVWDVKTGKPLLRFEMEPVFAVAFAKNGQEIITGTVTSSYLWNLKSKEKQVIYRGHNNYIVEVDVFPDDRRILTGSWDGTVRIWDKYTGEELSQLSGHTFSTLGMDITPDNSRIVTGENDRKVRVWDLVSGAQQKEFGTIMDSVESTAFSSDGQEILTGGSDGWVRLWDTRSGRLIYQYGKFDDWVISVAFSPDGSNIAAGGRDGQAFLWEKESGVLIAVLHPKENFDTLVSFSGDGKYIFVANFMRLEIFSANDGSKLKDYLTVPILSLAVSPDNRTVAIGSETQVILLDVESGETLQTYTGHTDWISSIAFSQDENRLITGSWDKTVKLWDVPSGRLQQTFVGHEAEVHSVEITPDGSNILSAAWDFQVRLWDVPTGQVLKIYASEIDSTPYSINSLALAPDQQHFLTGSISSAEMWEIQSGQIRQTYSGHVGPVYSLQCNAEGSQIATGSTRAVKLWDLDTGNLIRSFYCPALSVLSVAFSPQSAHVASAGDDHLIRIWDCSTGDPVRILSGHTDAVIAIAFSPDGRYLLSASKDKSVILWNWADGQVVYKFHSLKEQINSLAFAPDGNLFVIGVHDGTLAIGSIHNLAPLQTFEGHDGVVTSLDFSPDGQYILSGGMDKTLRLWNVSNRQVVRSFSGLVSEVKAVAFTPNGKKVAAVGHDGVTRLWEMDAPRAILLAGGGDYAGNGIAEQTKKLAQYAYKVLLARGYDKKDIVFLSAFPDQQDLDENSIPDVQGPATRENLNDAIRQWAVSDLISLGRRLFIYMIDHGIPIADASGKPNIYFKLNPEQSISAEELNTVLADLTSSNKHIDLTFILESCYSGDFVQKLIPPLGVHRLVISSAQSDTLAMIMPPPDLTSFSHFFLGAAYMGSTLKDSLRKAEDFFYRFDISKQRPQMDDNGDGLYTEQDGQRMGQNRLGRSWAYAGQGAAEIPVFESTSPQAGEILTVNPQDSILLQAIFTPGSDPLDVWAVIQPPYSPTIAGEPVSVSSNIRIVNLVRDSNKPNLWSIEADPLREEGSYSISFFARFPFNRISTAVSAKIQSGVFPSPEEVVVLKAILVAGGESEDLRAFARDMTDYAQSICLERGYAPNDVRIVGRDNPATKEELIQTLRETATSLPTGKPIRLFLYLLGDVDSESYFHLSNQEKISVHDLISYLNDLQQTNSRLEIILLADGSYSGQLVQANTGFTSYRRVVMAGTDFQTAGMYTKSSSLISFSRYFLRNAYQGMNLKESYEGAETFLKLLGGALPIYDDTGDGKKNKQDGKLAREWFLGRRNVQISPQTLTLQTLRDAGALVDDSLDQVRVWVDLVQAAPPEQVWVEILPPASPIFNSDLAKIVLSREGISWHWSQTIPFSSFGMKGEYKAVIFAEYPGGQLSSPLIVNILLPNTQDIRDWKLQ